ncbi:hypothetical protein OAO35_01610 [Euryarchaeota archaeon]|jgi:hypothetical protein|nr:hypothetical protein [Euryarchaeota archaeon]
MDLDNISENTEIYVENNEYIILNNSDMIPIIIWKDKKVVRDLVISRAMKKALQEVGEEKYGRGNFFIDRFQKSDEEYLTWYCRPNRNPELIEEQAKKNRK